MALVYNKLSPRYSTSRGCWLVDVPSTLAGTRRRFFYQSESEALRGAAEVALQLEMGVTPSPSGTRTRIADLASSYIASRNGVVSAHTQRQSKWGLKLFCERFGNLAPEQVTRAMVDSWVASLPLETRGKFNAFAVSRALFNHLDLPAAFRSPPPKTPKGHRLEILTVEQATTLVNHPFPDFFKCWLVGGMFAGLRTCEMQRITHECIDWEYKEIVIRKEHSKGGNASRPRTITIQEPFARHIPRLTGSFLGGSGYREFAPQMKVMNELMGWEHTRKNINRHTFASMHLACFKSAPSTAYELGHSSPTLVYSCYANCVSHREALQFWRI